MQPPVQDAEAPIMSTPGREELAPSRLFPGMRLGIYELAFSPSRPLKPLDYAGSTWRGAFGNALKARSCPWGERGECPQCRVGLGCVYHLCFEKTGVESGFANPPRPYVVNPVTNGGDVPVLVRLTLVGMAADQVAVILAAMEDAGARGIGEGRVRCRLESISQLLPGGRFVRLDQAPPDQLQPSYLLVDYLREPAPPPPWRVTIPHPLRIRKDGRDLRYLDWPAAWKSFAIRSSILYNFYHDVERLPSSTWQAVIALLSDPGRSRDATQSFAWQRYSSTQRRHVGMDGVVGESLVTPPPGLEIFWWRWWRTAELLHIGKGADMGMGWVRLAAAGSSRDSFSSSQTAVGGQETTP